MSDSQKSANIVVCHMGRYLDSPAVLGEHLETNGRAKDCEDCHEDNVEAHLPSVSHQIEHSAK